jgi:diguanylate cyclase (GGDEF)-like protein
MSRPQFALLVDTCFKPHIFVMKIIFVVDDNDTNLMAAKAALDGTYKSFLLASAAQMLKLIDKKTPDLILLDIDMPEMDGFEAIKALKDDERFADIPVIFLTAKSDEESEVTGFELGAVDYVSKPFSTPIIKARIATHLKMVEQKRIIEQLSLTDTLTQLPNRRSFDYEMSKRWREAIENQSSIGMLMLDADKFKVFNDTYGHQQGDVALQSLANILKTSVREGDFAVRWGGEEFAVILPDTDSETVVTVAENIRKNVQESIIPLVDGVGDGGENSDGLSITVSLGGFSAKISPASSLDEFIKKADEALYSAKEQGRNRVCMWEAK